MATITKLIEKYHKFIILLFIFVIFAMAASCIFHDTIPICHWLFGCDYKLHVATSL
jgi:hypothetical protein